jgi:hypothetical protein
VRLLALLLARPGQQIHSLELVAAVDRLPPGNGGAVPQGGRFVRQGGTGPALDAAAKRARETASNAERARINVTRGIRSAIKRVRGYDPELGAELAAAVRTGAYCVYAPDPRRPRRWRIEDGGR